MARLNQNAFSNIFVHGTMIILPVSKFKGDIKENCKLIRNRSHCKDIDWTTYTCVLGFQVFGKDTTTLDGERRFVGALHIMLA